MEEKTIDSLAWQQMCLRIERTDQERWRSYEEQFREDSKIKANADQKEAKRLIKIRDTYFK